MDKDLKKGINQIANDSSGKQLLTEKEAKQLANFMQEHGKDGHFTKSVEAATTNATAKSLKQIGTQTALSFLVALTAMTASGAIAAAVASDGG